MFNNIKNNKEMKKLNKFDIFMSIGVIFLITLGTILACSCQAQETTDDIPDMEYYDPQDPLIALYADGVIDFIYHTQDNEYVIEYDDPDAFDPDNMLYNDIFDYYYIEIYCDSADFYEYLTWYSKLTHHDDRFSVSNATFGICEDSIIKSDNSRTYYYRLERRH